MPDKLQHLGVKNRHVVPFGRTALEICWRRALQRVPVDWSETPPVFHPGAAVLNVAKCLVLDLLLLKAA